VPFPGEDAAGRGPMKHGGGRLRPRIYHPLADPCKALDARRRPS
jgi:hypothetical protein